MATDSKSLKTLTSKRPLHLFSPAVQFPPFLSHSKKLRISHKVNVEFAGIQNTTDQPPYPVKSASQDHNQHILTLSVQGDSKDSQNTMVGPAMPSTSPHGPGFPSKSIVVALPSCSGSSERKLSTSALIEKMPSIWPRPIWHAPWKNYRVISGDLGCVRSIAVDPSNTWFCTGSADGTIKIWDLAKGTRKLTLTGHIGQIRGLAISNRHTYMFSAGDDKQVKCWDLEQNKVIRSYHGHLSGVYCLALHPTNDILLTGGRDQVCRVWDIRSKTQIWALSGHVDTVCSVLTRPTEPQVITGSHNGTGSDNGTIKMWDLRNGKNMLTLTHHKKSVRAMAPHPKEQSFASASADGIKKFNLPNGDSQGEMLSQQKTTINAMAVNKDGVMATAGDNGSLWFWDWKSGHNFQQAQTIVQPGSLDCEAGIHALTYDVTGTRLITCEADKTIKMWKEVENATPETFPLKFRPPKDIQRF